ncbi:PRC-barrel domain-containing protein [Falsiroseomonas tokyonensis]|uniref:PRC-barrel domain-containing protein n=1 Tax=Falsiroseomonas tokyonensis TaxID=430521 RepID=A0ABV7BM35_9PROT|nr:PRC-barrel domain-containing protein [Falsiroseomonas tokyonensis]MBU8536610.1 PRC-barrel domain-containing protein [Falsiroseomonas tokyonensis]
MLTTAAVVALGISGTAVAQQQQAQQNQAQQGNIQTPSGNPLAPQLQAVERSLRQSQQQLSQQGADAPQPNWEQARRAVSAGQEALGRTPSELQGQDAFDAARTRLSDARVALQGSSPDRQRAAMQLREAADAMAALHGRLTSAESSGSQGGTSNSGRRQTAVQQAQPQVNGQRPDQARSETAQRDQRTGATTATPAPAQSGGARSAAVSPAAGVPLQRVSNLIGTNVVGANGRESGEVENLLLDRQGNVRAALVEWGGFLGIGTRRAMVPMERIELGSQPARLNMTREELEALPRYDEANIAAYGRERGWGEGIRMAR